MITVQYMSCLLDVYLWVNTLIAHDLSGFTCTSSLKWVRNFNTAWGYRVPRVPKRFCGMQDLAFLRWDIWDLSWKRAGNRNSNYKWKWDFVVLWGWEARFAGKRARYGSKFSHDLVNWPAQKTACWQKWAFCACSCVRFQVMNSNGSVQFQVLSNLFIIAWLC